MPRVSRSAIESRLARIAREIEAIDAERPATFELFMEPENETVRVALEHRIFIAIQAMLDIASHIVASAGLGAPPTAQDAMNELARIGVVPGSVIEGVEGAAGLRNAIAHLYLQLDPEQVYEGLTKTPEMKRFAASVWEWLELQ